MRLNTTQFNIDGGGEGNYTPRKPLAPSPLAAQESGAIGAASMASQAKSDSAATAAMRSPSALASKESGAIGAASMASQYKEPGKGAGMTAAKAKTPVDRSGYDRSIKVSQSTVDAVKDAGRGNMGAVPQGKVKNGAPGYNGSTFSPNAPVSAEYKEATKRVYPNAAKEPKAAAPKAAPKNYGGAAAEKYKAEEKNAKNKSAFPSILPAPSTPTPKAKPNSAATLPPLMTPPAAKPKAAAPAKVKVSQATVDAVKAQGKSKAIANAKGNVSNAEYKEAVRRIYQSPAKLKPAPQPRPVPKKEPKVMTSSAGRSSSAVK
jgi:hypothetical protein